MFGLKKMRKQRERLYVKTVLLESRAECSRKRFAQDVLDVAISPEGLAASFILGLTTQSDLANKNRSILLKGIRPEFIRFIKEGFLSLREEKSTPSSDGNSTGL